MDAGHTPSLQGRADTMGRRGCKIEEEGGSCAGSCCALGPRIRFGWTTAPRRVCTRGTLTFARVTRARQKHLCPVSSQSKVNHLQLLRLAGLHLPLGANEVFGAPHLVGNLDRNGSYYVPTQCSTQYVRRKETNIHMAIIAGSGLENAVMRRSSGRLPALITTSC